ncbi:hypothetical protein [Nostoc sp.]|uniref:hypothetical protein n=1 Tax=Nostoc sp. TaxID=1180 RepID=UPI002FF92019
MKIEAPYEELPLLELFTQLREAGLPTELDIEATIEQVLRQGVLLEPILMPSRVNRTELLLLIDHKGSMVPFHALSQRLAETALRGGGLGKASICYFYNCPTKYLYHDQTRQQAEPVVDFLAQLRPERSAVLIFSDGGAVRGGFSLERLGINAKIFRPTETTIALCSGKSSMEFVGGSITF